MKLTELLKEFIRKESVRHTLFVYFGSLINGGSLFLLNIVLARILTKESFGIFSLSVLVLSTVAEMSDFGLNAGLLRFAPYYISTGQEDKLKQLLHTIWRWRVSLSLSLMAGSALLSGVLASGLFRQPEVTPYLAFTSLGIGGVILLGLLSTWLQAKQRFFYSASVQSLKGALRLVVVIILYLFHVTNLYIYLSVYLFVPWILFILNFGVFPKGFTRHKASEEVRGAVHSQLAKFSFWLTITSLTSILASKTDQIMISRYLGLEEVAVFTVAYQLIQFFPLIYNSISAVLTPKASSLRNKAELAVLVKKTLVWVGCVTLLIALFVYPSQYIIKLFFGMKYESAMPIYLILSYSLLLNILAIPFSLIINIYNKTHLSAISGVIQIILNIVGNMIFIPRYGIMGVPFTFAFSNVFQIAWNSSWAVYYLRNKDFKIE
jgi:O-antigen/teichoic acid export membrane protein